MSRLGKRPIEIPDKVQITIKAGKITVKGPHGELQRDFADQVKIEKEDKFITIQPNGSDRFSRCMHGTAWSLISSMIKGVTEGFQKKLELVGIGYRASVNNRILNLKIGYSHDINYPIPEGIEIQADKPPYILVKGIDKEKVGQSASEIRAFKPPEPYKGKGIRYSGEWIKQKVGKAGA